MAIAFLQFGLVGAAIAAAKPDAPDFVPPHTVAMLPLANQSKDEAAALDGRFLFNAALEDRGYTALPLGKIDEILSSQFDVNDSAGLAGKDPVKLAGGLGVDALIYGTVVKSKAQNIGVYQNNEIQLAFKMVDGRTGRTMWEDSRNAFDKTLRTSLKAAAGAAAVGAAEKILKQSSSSSELTAKAVKWCALRLPRAGGGKSKVVTTQTSSYSHSVTTEEEEVVEEK